MRWRDLLELPRLSRVVREPLSFVKARRAAAAGELYPVRLRDGRTLRLRSGSRDFHVFHRIYVRDEYGLDDLDLTPESLVIDVGAHGGFFALRVASEGSRVVCVEPAADNLELLYRTIRDNELEDRVTVCARALTGSAGEFKLVSGKDPCAHEVHEAADPRPGESVEAITLRELLEQNRIEACELLKLDCEGSEYGILLETPPEYLQRIERIRLEFHPGRRGDEDPARLRDFLIRCGFRVEMQRSKKRAAGQGLLFFARQS